MRAWVDWLSTVRSPYCALAPRGSALGPVALRVYIGFASIPQTCLACLNIAWSCASPKKPKENARSLTEKQMWHRHNSVLASLDHSEARIDGPNLAPIGSDIERRTIGWPYSGEFESRRIMGMEGRGKIGLRMLRSERCEGDGNRHLNVAIGDGWLFWWRRKGRKSRFRKEDQCALCTLRIGRYRWIP
jgi:hypothetical protein